MGLEWHSVKPLSSYFLTSPFYDAISMVVSKKYQQFLKVAKTRRQAIIRAAGFFGTRLTAEKFKISRQRVNQIMNGK